METRDQILRLAYKEFAKYGFKFSVKNITEELGITKQAIYYYYSNKEQLLNEVIKSEIDLYFKSKIIEFDKNSDLTSIEQLENIFKSIAMNMLDEEKLSFWRWILVVDSEHLDAEIEQRIQEYKRMFNERLIKVFNDALKEERINIMEVEAHIQLFVSLFQGTVDGMLVFHKRGEGKEYINRVWKSYETLLKN